MNHTQTTNIIFVFFVVWFVFSTDARFICNSRSVFFIWPVLVFLSCAALARVRKTNFSPVTGRSSRSSTRNIKQTLELGTRAMLIGREPLQLQAYVHKIVRRPWTGVFELQALSVFFRDLVDHGVELRFAIALDQESGIHNHLVADRLVIARSHAHITECLINLSYILGGPFAQSFVNHPAELHAREVR